MTANTRSDLLSRALRIAQRFKETVGPSCANPTTPRPTPNIVIPPLNLEVPADVQAELADSNIIAELRDTLQRAVTDSHVEYRRIYETACQRALTSPVPQLHALQTLASLLAKRFRTQVIPGLFKQYLAAKEEIARSIQAASTIPSTSSKAFNHAFIPILTAYFMWNAFPSAADKRILATKGLMTDRQIDVWFQNRRALARKHGMRIDKAAYKTKTKNGVPPELMKDINEFTSFSSPGYQPPQQTRKDDEEQQWRWSVGWGSLGLSGLWERGRIVAHSVLEKNKQDVKVKPVDILAMHAPLADAPRSMEEWSTLRKEGKIIFDSAWLKAPYAQRTTVVPSPAPPVPDPRPSAQGELSLRRVTEMFADAGRIHFGPLGVKNEGDEPSQYLVGAATMGVSRDVRWYVSRIGSWNAPRRPAVKQVEVKAKKRKTPEKKEKKRLGERRQPTSRYEPYPNSSRSSKSSLRSHGSSSSLSSVSSRTPSLTFSSSSSDDDDDMEDLFGGGVQLDLEGFAPVATTKGTMDPYVSMGMGMDMPGMGYGIGYSNIDLGVNNGSWGLLGDVF